MEQRDYVIDDEIDLRQYVNVLIQYRYWIAGLAVAAALVAFIFSSLRPASYEAKALVTATQSRYELQFDPRFRDVPDTAIQSLLESQYRTYPTLANGDSLLKDVAEQVKWDIEDVKAKTKADTLANAPNMLILTVSGTDPEEVAAVANTWATIFVDTVNDLYGGGDEVDRYVQQKRVVGQSLAEADAALTRFRQEKGVGLAGNHDLGLLGQQLQAKTELLTHYETQLRQIQQQQREVELLSQTAAGNSSPVLIAGLLAEMVNSGIIRESQSFQIKLDTVEPAVALAAMQQALQGRETAIEAETEPLRAEIAALQTEIATQQEVLEQLLRDQDVKAETFAVISRKVQEAQIDSFSEGSNTGRVEIASQAIVPTKPLPSGRLRNTAVAGVLGLLAGVFGAFMIEWWRSEQENQ